MSPIAVFNGEHYPQNIVDHIYIRLSTEWVNLKWTLRLACICMSQTHLQGLYVSFRVYQFVFNDRNTLGLPSLESCVWSLPNKFAQNQEQYHRTRQAELASEHSHLPCTFSFETG